ncbi:MAG: tetratricopeptide repeat protein [Acidobacteria bacterium]|nr:tetratricopeptide repeat protein [Acidobacteriota bacterium]
MKATERHHLKENEFETWVIGVKDWYEANRNLVIYGGFALLLLAVGVAGTVAYRQSAAAKAAGSLAEAMSVAEAQVVAPTAAEAGKAPTQPAGTFPTDKARLEAALPKLMAVADAYPAADAGIMARYRAASALVALGKTAEGIQRYQEVAAKGTGIYRVMAKLGIADAQVAAGQFDQAIASYKEVSALNADDAPADGILMQLARAYRLAGKTDEAKKTFKRVADEYPQSPYAPLARREMESSGPLDVASR